MCKLNNILSGNARQTGIRIGCEQQAILYHKNITGIETRPCSYTPTDSLYKNETCYGLELNITDTNSFHPVTFGIHVISVLFKLYPQQIKGRAYVTNVNLTGGGHLDKLLGVKNTLELFRSNASIETNVSKIWSKEIARYLLYS